MTKVKHRSRLFSPKRRHTERVFSEGRVREYSSPMKRIASQRMTLGIDNEKTFKDSIQKFHSQLSPQQKSYVTLPRITTKPDKNND